MLVENSTVSRISICSKKNSDKSKGSPSTESPESPSMRHAFLKEFPSCEDYWASETQEIKIKNLEQSINDMEKYQL